MSDAPQGYSLLHVTASPREAADYPCAPPDEDRPALQTAISSLFAAGSALGQNIGRDNTAGLGQEGFDLMAENGSEADEGRQASPDAGLDMLRRVTARLAEDLTGTGLSPARQATLPPSPPQPFLVNVPAHYRLPVQLCPS